MEIEYKHKVTVSPNHWLIRSYCWLWDADRDNIDFCHLFWGFFPPFLVLNVILRVVFYPIYLAGSGVILAADSVKDHRRERKERLEEALAKLGLPKPKPKKSSLVAWAKSHDTALLLTLPLPLIFIDAVVSVLLAPSSHGQANYGFTERAVGHGGVSLSMAAIMEIGVCLFLVWRMRKPAKPKARYTEPLYIASQPFAMRALGKTVNGLQRGWFLLTSFTGWLWPKIRWLWLKIRKPLIVGLSLALIGGSAIGLWIGVPPFIALLITVPWLAILTAIGILVGSAAAAIGMVICLVAFKEGWWDKKEHKAFRETKVGSGFYLLGQGAIAFKSNTCPKIEIAEDE